MYHVAHLGIAECVLEQCFSVGIPQTGGFIYASLQILDSFKSFKIHHFWKKLYNYQHFSFWMSFL